MHIITISREEGSGGDYIAYRIAEKIGFEYVDQVNMKKVAEKLVLSRDKLLDSEEEILSSSEGFSQMRSILLAIAEKCDVVILGRGGQVLFQNNEKAFHIRITAPLDLRVKKFMIDNELTEDEARREVVRKDALHHDYVLRFYGIDSRDLHLYHMVINTAKIDLDKAAENIVFIARRNFGII